MPSRAEEMPRRRSPQPSGATMLSDGLMYAPLPKHTLIWTSSLSIHSAHITHVQAAQPYTPSVCSQLVISTAVAELQRSHQPRTHKMSYMCRV
jgi:hypothetical protein